jgi:hypothetical protein
VRTRPAATLRRCMAYRRSPQTRGVAVHFHPAGRHRPFPLPSPCAPLPLKELPHSSTRDGARAARRAGRLPTGLSFASGHSMAVWPFRSTFRDWAAERTNFPREVAEAALAHIDGDETERAYQRGDLFQKRRHLMDAWAKYCASKAPAAADNVRPLWAAVE